MDDLESHVPRDPECLCVIVRAMVGPRGLDGEESFDIRVCTPKWLDKEVQAKRLVFQRAVLVVDHYDPVEIRRFLTEKVESLSALTWQELGLKLSRLGVWEFEEYRG